jgi:hypothetical protein
MKPIKLPELDFSVLIERDSQYYILPSYEDVERFDNERNHEKETRNRAA